MSTTQLQLYNGALRKLGQRTIASLSVNEESRRLLDDAWADGLVQNCLEDGFWSFALRSTKLDYDPSITPAWGPRYAFQRPSDFVRTFSLSQDESQYTPLEQYKIEAKIWYSNITPIYLTYVSLDPAYGLDYSKWPQSFGTYVEFALAQQIGPRLTASTPKMDGFDKKVRVALATARTQDSMEQPTRPTAPGRWARSRGAGMGFGSRRSGPIPNG